VTEQALHEGSGSFSFELLEDNPKDDELTCFGVVDESKLSSIPKDLHTSSGSKLDGIAYLRSYNGKLAHSGGSQEDGSCHFHVGDGRQTLEARG